MLYLSMLIMPGRGSSEAELTRSLLKDYEKLARPVNVTKEVGRHFKDIVLWRVKKLSGSCYSRMNAVNGGNLTALNPLILGLKCQLLSNSFCFP